MKKKNLTLFAMLFVCAALAFGFSACTQKHEHTYDRQVISENYLAEKATCTTKARYYYSCSCGEKGSGTFEYGDFTAHPAESEWSYDETHHWHNSACACNVKVDYGEHKIDDSGCCSVCERSFLSDEGVIYEVSADGTYAEVVGYEGSSKYVKISDTYNNLPVRNICKEAFNDAEIITVIIPDSVISIDVAAFYHCGSLASITIPDSVISIGNAAFSYCESLTSITIPGSITSINDYVFSYCDSLASITIPDGVTSIGDYAFSGCHSLTSVTIPDGVTSIGNYAFSLCESLTSITIPDSVISIECFTFDDCDKLQYNVYGNAKYLGNADNPYHALITVENNNLSSYEIHNKTKAICDRAFKDCGRLASITIPDGVISIGNSAFSYCRSLTSITIPDGVISIGDDAFSYCTSLTSITILDGVISIGYEAFYDCRSLTSITIPDSVISIDNHAFVNCDSLTNITYMGTIAQWKKIEKAPGFYCPKDLKIHCTDGVVNAYRYN